MGRYVYILGPWEDPESSNELSCEARSFSHHLNPHKVLQSEVLRPYFPSLEPWVARSVSLPSCSSWFIHMQMWDHLVLQLLPCCSSSPPWLLISTNSLPVRMNVSSLTPWLSDFHTVRFCQFWLFVFFFKFVVVLLLVVWGDKVYLPMPPSWLITHFSIFSLLFPQFKTLWFSPVIISNFQFIFNLFSTQ